MFLTKSESGGRPIRAIASFCVGERPFVGGHGPLFFGVDVNVPLLFFFFFRL